ncbi:SGNH hydrolase [Rhodotorula sp. JG-1b]|nr:SGNH hydrolase [Rhodotorula sp. JG-1b]
MSAPLQSDLFICVGDSLTEQSWSQNGLGATLADLYRRKLDVVNRGLGGYNTDWGLEAFKRWFPRKENRHSKIQFMTIWWGANDATLPGQTQHVPLDRFRGNIREMVSLVRDDPASPYYSPETSIILINAPSFYPEHWLDERVKKGLPREHDRDLEVTRKYAEEVKSLGEELGVPVADAYAAVAKEVDRVGEDNPEAIWSDGLHLTSTSYAAVAKEVMRVIETVYPEKHWDKLEMMLPDWKDIATGALGPQFDRSEKAEKAVEHAVAAGTDPF